MYLSVRNRSVYLIIFIMIRTSTSETYCRKEEDNPGILETCDNLSAVKIINISNIPLNTFNYSVFAKCNSTMDLNISNVSLYHVSMNLFSGMTSLQSLFLNDNLIRTLNNESFGEIRNLLEIFLNNNAISSIAEGTFQNLKNLRAVYIKNNSIDVIDRHAFPADNVLKHLDLRHNNLKDLNFVQNLSLIKKLYLPFNKIEILEQDIFVNLVDLLYLDLKYNLIGKLPINLFNTQKKLIQIDLAHNRLVQIETGTFNIGFRDLLLNDNNLTLIAMINNISEVNIERNYLEHLPALPKNNVTLLIDENPWECQFIHDVITYHPNINLKFTFKNNSKNVRGIPCKDTQLGTRRIDAPIINKNDQIINRHNRNDSNFWTVFSLYIIIAACVIISLILMTITLISCRREKKILPERTSFEERKYVSDNPRNNSAAMETGYLTPILPEHIYEEIDHYTESPV